MPGSAGGAPSHLREGKCEGGGKRDEKPRSPLGRAALVGIERVSRRTDSADDIAVAGDVEGLAQSADMDIDRPRLDIDILAPHRIEELLTRINATGMQHEEAERTKFRRAEVNGLAIT